MKTTRSLPFARWASAALFTGLLAACGSMGTAHMGAPAKMENGVLVGNNGMTLYVFDKDAGGKSACNGMCAANWPPYLATGGAHGDFGVITRDDGKQQYAYKGKPLYYWVKDQKPGDKTGDGVNNVWHVVK